MKTKEDKRKDALERLERLFSKSDHELFGDNGVLVDNKNFKKHSGLIGTRKTIERWRKRTEEQILHLRSLS